MTGTRMKRDLFGGTLYSAGIVGTAMLPAVAHAQFRPAARDGNLSGETQIFAEHVGGSYIGAYAYESNAGSFVDSLSYSEPGWTSSAYASSTIIGASISEFDSQLWTEAFASVFQWVSVGNPQQVLVEWDFTGMESGRARIYDYYASSNLLHFIFTPGSDPVGSAILTLEPEELYLFSASVGSTDEFDGTGFVRFTSIPAPGAIALLGLGMINRRRRRRE